MSPASSFSDSSDAATPRFLTDADEPTTTENGQPHNDGRYDGRSHWPKRLYTPASARNAL